MLSLSTYPPPESWQVTFGTSLQPVGLLYLGFLQHAKGHFCLQFTEISFILFANEVLIGSKEGGERIGTFCPRFDRADGVDLVRTDGL